MAKFRFHRGTIDESMESCVDVETRFDIAQLFGVQQERVKIKPYGFDKRINWDTYIVTIYEFSPGYGDCAVGFTDGPIND